MVAALCGNHWDRQLRSTTRRLMRSKYFLADWLSVTNCFFFFCFWSHNSSIRPSVHTRFQYILYIRLPLCALRCYPSSVQLIRYFVSLLRCNKLPTPYAQAQQRQQVFTAVICSLFLSSIYVHTLASIFSYKLRDGCRTLT